MVSPLRLYRTRISHARSAPVRHAFAYRSYSWLVDVDRLDELPPLYRRVARFAARDFGGDPTQSIAATVRSRLAREGIACDGRILMLAAPRSFGHAFNPLTVFWCRDGAGQLVAVIAEVHNTYGGRHRYVLHGDGIPAGERGRAAVDKALRVSPFHDVSGRYRLELPEPDATLRLVVRLEREGGAPFVACVHGREVPGSPLRHVLAVLSAPALLTSARIRRHGIALWLKGVPVHSPTERKGHHVAELPVDPSTRTAHAAQRIEHILAPSFGGTLPVRITAWDGSCAGPPEGPAVHVRTPQALRRLLWSPAELAFAQSYVLGEIEFDGDLADGLRTVRRAAGEHGDRRRPRPRQIGAAAAAAARWRVVGPRPPIPDSQARLVGRLHSRARDAQVIAHHYDLSNDFYALLLDESMSYSSAYWTSGDPSYTLADAQRDKLDLICRELGMAPGTRHLDIGCGWGALALHAAAHYGARVLAVTLSEQQRAYVSARVEDRGLDDLVEVRRQDYRDVPAAAFDSVSAIEMGEHVGAANYPAFAAALRDLVRPGGRVLIQQMSRRSRPGGGPFIEAFIAPDMHMRPVGETVELLEAAGLEVRHVRAMREHYVRTIAAWQDRFEARWDEAVAMIGEEAARVWRLYLAGGLLAFDEGRMGVDQIVAVRRAGQRSVDPCPPPRTGG